jgi:hypothetical protein
MAMGGGIMGGGLCSLPWWTIYVVFQRSARFKFKHLRSSRMLFYAVHEKPQCMVHEMRSSQFKIHAVQVHAFSRSRFKFTTHSSPSQCTAQFTSRSAAQHPSAAPQFIAPAAHPLRLLLAVCLPSPSSQLFAHSRSLTSLLPYSTLSPSQRSFLA